jgi:hypothetical protein
VSNGTAEVFTPDGDADEERGIAQAEMYANFYTEDGQLRTADVTEANPTPLPEQPTEIVLETVAEEMPSEPKGSTEFDNPQPIYGKFTTQLLMEAGRHAVRQARRNRTLITGASQTAMRAAASAGVLSFREQRRR